MVHLLRSKYSRPVPPGTPAGDRSRRSSAGRTAATALCLLLAAGLGIGRVIGASAHAVRPAGQYTLAIGWAHEPTFVGEPNAVQVIVKDAKGSPVTDLGLDDLKVTVSLGNASVGPMSLEPRFDPDTGLGTPGDYEAAIIPTVTGDYTFHVTGTIHGQAVDQTVTAGPNTFDTVKSAQDLEFPTKVPALSDLATEVGRVNARVQSALTAAGSAGNDARSAQDAATRATIIAIVAIVLAMVGTAAGVIVGRRRAG
jgi:hypothetical protein